MRSIHRIRLPWLPLLLAVLACGDDPVVPLDEVPPVFRTERAPGPSWPLVERTAFSFRLPPGFVDQGLQPIDSDAVHYVRGGDGSTLTFDYGFYTARIEAPDGATDVREVWTRIGGHRVQLVAWRTADRGRVAAWWPRVARRTAMDEHLLLGGTYRGEEGRNDLMASIRSVRFH